MKVEVECKLRGVVKGVGWHDGRIYYSSREVVGGSKEEVLKKAHQAYKEGWLDGGFGFKKLLGFVGLLTEKRTMVYKGREWENKETEVVIFGRMGDREVEAILDELYWMEDIHGY